MTPKQLSYAAAVIDCEGHIAIRRTGRRQSGKPGNWYLLVQVSNSDVRLSTWLKNHVGGSIYGPYRNKVKGETYGRPWWSWEFYGKPAAAFLEAIVPELIVKGDQAEVGIAFAATLGRGGRRLSEEVVSQREGMAGQLLQIRKVGGPASA